MQASAIYGINILVGIKCKPMERRSNWLPPFGIVRNAQKTRVAMGGLLWI